MFFHIQLIDDPTVPEKRAAYREAHWAYFDAHRDHFVARGATVTDDFEGFLSSVLFVEFDGWDEVRAFIDNEPLNSNGVYREVRIRRWTNAIKRNQRDFPRREDQTYWYIRGFGKPGANDRRNELLDAHLAYFKPYDEEHFIARGAVLSDDGTLWDGSANLIALPSRADVEAFLSTEPFYSNGLYENVLVERYKFGGRPGQVA
ncbi:MAG: YciI family protein [Proteobacteria bacterium]|nr:YciI family protein [Pseudomonadota bacterium]